MKPTTSLPLSALGALALSSCSTFLEPIPAKDYSSSTTYYVRDLSYYYSAVETPPESEPSSWDLHGTPVPLHEVGLVQTDDANGESHFSAACESVTPQLAPELFWIAAPMAETEDRGAQE